MIRLGLRLAALGGRWSLVPMALTAVAVAFGTSILLFALSFQPALEIRYDRGAWRETPGRSDAAAHVPGMTLISLTNDYVEGRPLARLDVAAVGSGGPLPPGLERLPQAGETFVSPALAELIAQRRGDELGDRFGTIVGTIGEAGLRAPNEFVVIHGMSVESLQAAGSRGVTAFESDGQPPTLDWMVALLVVIAAVGAIAPVAVFVASSTRLAAARRERRLVALRLSGATPGQVSLLAALDALLITVPGAVLGIVLFFLLRPGIALFPLGDLTWFPDAIVPPLLPAALVVAAVPVVGVAASVFALRRMSISPLGVARRVGSGPPTRWRAAPVVIAFIAFGASIVLSATPFARGSEFVGLASLIGVGLSFFGVIVGIVILGPLLTAYVGRILAHQGGPIRLLAGRRLHDEPAASFTGVAGVVMSVFVASAFFGLIAFTGEVSGATRVALRADTLYAAVPPGRAAGLDPAVEAVQTTRGVLATVVVREAAVGDPAVTDPADPSTAVATAWIVPCADLLTAADLPLAACGTADVHLVSDDLELPDGARLLSYPVDATAQDMVGRLSVDVGLRGGATVDRLIPSGTRDTAGPLPDLIIEPSAVEDDGRSIRPAFVLAATDGTRTTVERARTVLETAMPTSGPATGAEIGAAATRIIDELGRIVTLGVVLTMAVAGASLAIAVTGGLLDRRRPFALLRLSGVPLRNLRSVVLLEAAAPLIGVAVLSAILGVLVSQLLLRLVAGNTSVPLPDPSLGVLLVAGVAGALAIVASMLPLVGPLTDLEETRFE
jgi:hypothetical protein